MAKTRYLEKIVDGTQYNTLVEAVNAGAIINYHRQYHSTRTTLDAMGISYDEQELGQAMYETSRKAIVQKIKELESGKSIPEVAIINTINYDEKTSIKQLPFEQAIIRILKSGISITRFKVLSEGKYLNVDFSIQTPRHKEWVDIVEGNELLVSKFNYGDNEQYQRLSVEYVKPDGEEG